MLWRHNLQSGCSAVGSASGLGPECREFESLHSDHVKPLKLLGFSGFYFLKKSQKLVRDHMLVHSFYF